MLEQKELVQFGERVRNRRNALHYNQEYVAEKTGITLRFYQMLERGEKSLSLDTLMRLGRVLNISVDYLLFGELGQTLEEPVAGIFRELSPKQREDALKLLQIYGDACRDN